MTTYADAAAAILNAVAVLPSEEKRLLQCLGLAAAEDVFSGLDLPQEAGCGPDGYALRSEDIAAADRDNPVELTIMGTARAGSPFRGIVTPGCAARVMTGSILPEGADCVVRFEDTDEPKEKNGPRSNCPSTVKVYVPGKPGWNVIKVGFVARKGELIVSKGTVIGPTQLSALITIGIAKLRVVRRPVIAIIATGDELTPMGKPLKRGQTYNSNAAVIAALVKQNGGVPKILGIARDNEKSLMKKLGRGFSADAIITTGGVSKGDFDLMRLVLGKIGSIVFASIDMGPGKAVVFGLVPVDRHLRGGAPLPVFALSGPPVGCIINFETLVRPALRKMMGCAILRRPKISAPAIDAFSTSAPFPYVKWTRLVETAEGHQAQFNAARNASVLSIMGSANAFIIAPPNASIHPGDDASAIPLF